MEKMEPIQAQEQPEFVLVHGDTWTKLVVVPAHRRENWGRPLKQFCQYFTARPDKYMKMAKAVNPYGDGCAIEKIVTTVLSLFGKE